MSAFGKQIFHHYCQIVFVAELFKRVISEYSPKYVVLPSLSVDVPEVTGVLDDNTVDLFFFLSFASLSVNSPESCSNCTALSLPPCFLISSSIEDCKYLYLFGALLKAHIDSMLPRRVSRSAAASSAVKLKKNRTKKYHN